MAWLIRSFRVYLKDILSSDGYRWTSIRYQSNDCPERSKSPKQLNYVGEFFSKTIYSLTGTGRERGTRTSYVTTCEIAYHKYRTESSRKAFCLTTPCWVTGYYRVWRKLKSLTYVGLISRNHIKWTCLSSSPICWTWPASLESVIYEKATPIQVMTTPQLPTDVFRLVFVHLEADEIRVVRKVSCQLLLFEDRLRNRLRSAKTSMTCRTSAAFGRLSSRSM